MPPNSVSDFFLHQNDGASNYARWRRYLLTNPTLSMANTKATFKSLAPDIQVPLKISKNCPVCTKNFYHSSVYDVPWVTLCPIHNIPLTHICPECHRSWPTKHELHSRKCRTCGAKVSYPEVDIEALYRPPPCLSRITVIQKLLERHSQATGSIFCYGDVYRGFDRQHTVSLDDSLLPSLLSTHSRRVRQRLKASGITLSPLYTFKLDNLTQASNEVIQDCAAENDRIERESIAKIRYKLFQFIEFTIRNATYSGSTIKLDMSHVFKDTNIYFLAYAIWQELISKRHAKRHDWYRYEFGQLYRNTIRSGVPLTPLVKRCVAFDMIYRRFNGSLNVEGVKRFMLPGFVSRVLYELELWAMFFNILHFLDILKMCVIDKSLPLQNRLNRAPRKGWKPSRSCALQLAIIRTGGNSMELIIPARQEFASSELFDDGRGHPPLCDPASVREGEGWYFGDAYCTDIEVVDGFHSVPF